MDIANNEIIHIFNLQTLFEKILNHRLTKRPNISHI